MQYHIYTAYILPHSPRLLLPKMILSITAVFSHRVNTRKSRLPTNASSFHILSWHEQIYPDGIIYLRLDCYMELAQGWSLEVHAVYFAKIYVVIFYVYLFILRIYPGTTSGSSNDTQEALAIQKWATLLSTHFTLRVVPRRSLNGNYIGYLAFPLCL